MSTPTDEAREMTKRWAWWRGEAERRDPHKLLPALDDAERERLFAWVRERIAALMEEHPYMRGSEHARPWVLTEVWREVMLTLAQTEALIDAAKGWPS